MRNGPRGGENINHLFSCLSDWFGCCANCNAALEAKVSGGGDSFIIIVNNKSRSAYTLAHALTHSNIHARLRTHTHTHTHAHTHTRSRSNTGIKTLSYTERHTGTQTVRERCRIAMSLDW